MDQEERDRLGRVVDQQVKSLFPDGAVRRAVLLRHGEDPAVPPGQLMIRVFISPVGSPAGESENDERDLAAWQEAHQGPMRELRRELSRRLPSARLLEFTLDGSGDSTPRITMPDDGTLAEHLHQVCDDKHLRVRLGGGPGPRPGPQRERVPEDAEPPDHELRRLKMRRKNRTMDNFGIRRVERLDGNVGYLDIRRVPVPDAAGPAISAAMELVSGTYALILDLRRNHGGFPDGVVYWCSYLLPGAGPSTHLNDIFHAGTGETRQFWSLPYVPGERYLRHPVYVLSSGETFSGGEDFCYTLQALGRAKVIGETTGGGAHPTRSFPISPAVHVAIPFARSISPVTGTNWQGTGVIPTTS
jgi:hypothetical protein